MCTVREGTLNLGGVMGNNRKGATTLALCCLPLLLIAIPAYGYIDPNAAGLASQILTPLLIAAAAAFTFFRKQARAVYDGMLRRLRRRADA